MPFLVLCSNFVSQRRKNRSVLSNGPSSRLCSCSLSPFVDTCIVCFLLLYSFRVESLILEPSGGRLENWPPKSSKSSDRWVWWRLSASSSPKYSPCSDSSFALRLERPVQRKLQRENRLSSDCAKASGSQFRISSISNYESQPCFLFQRSYGHTKKSSEKFWTSTSRCPL